MMHSLLTIFSLMMVPAVAMLTVSIVISALENGKSL